MKMNKKIRNPVLWRRLLSIAAIPMLFFNTGIMNEMGVINVPEAKAVATNERFIYVAENGNDFTGNGSSEVLTGQ